MIDWDNLEITQAPAPTEEDLLREAQAWGYDSWDAYCQAVDEASTEEAMLQADRDQYMAFHPEEFT